MRCLKQAVKTWGFRPSAKLGGRGWWLSIDVFGQPAPRNIPEELRPQLHRVGSLKSPMNTCQSSLWPEGDPSRATPEYKLRTSLLHRPARYRFTVFFFWYLYCFLIIKCSIIWLPPHIFRVNGIRRVCTLIFHFKSRMELNTVCFDFCWDLSVAISQLHPTTKFQYFWKSLVCLYVLKLRFPQDSF